MRRSLGISGCSLSILHVACTSSSLLPKPESHPSRSLSFSRRSIVSDGIPRSLMWRVSISALIPWAPQSVCPTTMTSSMPSSYRATITARIVSP